MSEMPSYSADRFPMDFVVSFTAGAVATVVAAPLTWYLARIYLAKTYPLHPELNSSAIAAGVLDGLLLGVGSFVITFAARIWIYERRLRQESDLALRRALREIGDSSTGDRDATNR